MEYLASFVQFYGHKTCFRSLRDIKIRFDQFSKSPNFLVLIRNFRLLYVNISPHFHLIALGNALKCSLGQSTL